MGDLKCVAFSDNDKCIDYVKFYLFAPVDLIVLYGDLIPSVIILLNRKYFQFNKVIVFSIFPMS